MAVGDVVASLSALAMDISVIKKLEIVYVHPVKLGRAAKLVRFSYNFLISYAGGVKYCLRYRVVSVKTI